MKLYQPSPKQQQQPFSGGDYSASGFSTTPSWKKTYETYHFGTLMNENDNPVYKNEDDLRWKLPEPTKTMMDNQPNTMDQRQHQNLFDCTSTTEKNTTDKEIHVVWLCVNIVMALFGGIIQASIQHSLQFYSDRVCPAFNGICEVIGSICTSISIVTIGIFESVATSIANFYNDRVCLALDVVSEFLFERIFTNIASLVCISFPKFLLEYLLELEIVDVGAMVDTIGRIQFYISSHKSFRYLKQLFWWDEEDDLGVDDCNEELDASKYIDRIDFVDRVRYEMIDHY